MEPRRRSLEEKGEEFTVGARSAELILEASNIP